MKKIWQQQDLAGKGLQSINLHFAAKKKDVRKAYLLAVFFPLGLHQFYLRQTQIGWIYILLTALLLALAKYSTFISALIGFVEIMLLVRDISRMENVVANYNKQLKMTLSLQQDNSMPNDFTGRYTDLNPPPQTGQKILSFNEQEALLKKLSRSKKEQ